MSDWPQGANRGPPFVVGGGLHLFIFQVFGFLVEIDDGEIGATFHD